MSFKTLISIAEDGPWCGTHAPGRPRPRPSAVTELSEFKKRAGPQPDPWAIGRIEVGLYGAIRLHQIGMTVTGPMAEALSSGAEFLFDDTCGSVPLSELIWILLHLPPPPPPWWLQQIVVAGEMLAFAQAGQQESLAAAAQRQALQGLHALGAAPAVAQTAA